MKAARSRRCRPDVDRAERVDGGDDGVRDVLAVGYVAERDVRLPLSGGPTDAAAGSRDEHGLVGEVEGDGHEVLLSFCFGGDRATGPFARA
ncbi:hypothetical protein [Jiangella gansuensis]|uniref:hypothetical protein n=1 Tax=Jiangella gansuensis TaxID=281473 RepID=UPI001B7FBC9E|nr:hypothetical protein [Jiangella gansuensis]